MSRFFSAPIALTLLLSFGANGAVARTSTCAVPLISTCQACVNTIFVMVRPNGSCRVRYLLNPAAVQGRGIVLRPSNQPLPRRRPGRTSQTAALSSVEIEITVEERRRRAFRNPALQRKSNRATASLDAMPAGSCFVFQNHKFCE